MEIKFLTNFIFFLSELIKKLTKNLKLSDIMKLSMLHVLYNFQSF